MPKPVYALVGSDSFLQLEKLLQLLREFPKDTQRIDLDGEKAELAEVLDELRCFAMFGEGKVVVLRAADAFVTRFREQLEAYLAKPANSSTLVLRLDKLPSNTRVYKLVQKVGAVESCEPPKNLPQWIGARARQVHKVTLTADAAELLAELVGDDMGRLDNELAKLALVTDGGKIGPADVEKNVSFQREQEMWHLTDELSRGQVADALRRWRQLVQMDSSAEFRAVTWLAMWLEKAYAAQQLSAKGLDPSAIGQQLKIWPREMQGAFVETARRLGEAGVTQAVNWLAEVDHHSKSGLGDATENVERFILSVGNLLGRMKTRG